MNEEEICSQAFINLGQFLYENGKKVSEYEKLMEKFSFLENSFVDNEKSLVELLEMKKNLKDKIYINTKSNNTKTFLYEYYSKNNISNKTNEILKDEYSLILEKIFSGNQLKNNLLNEIKDVSMQINKLKKEIEY